MRTLLVTRDMARAHDLRDAGVRYDLAITDDSNEESLRGMRFNHVILDGEDFPARIRACMAPIESTAKVVSRIVK